MAKGVPRDGQKCETGWPDLGGCCSWGQQVAVRSTKKRQEFVVGSKPKGPRDLHLTITGTVDGLAPCAVAEEEEAQKKEAAEGQQGGGAAGMPAGGWVGWGTEGSPSELCEVGRTGRVLAAGKQSMDGSACSGLTNAVPAAVTSTSLHAWDRGRMLQHSCSLNPELNRAIINPNGRWAYMCTWEPPACWQTGDVGRQQLEHRHSTLREEARSVQSKRLTAGLRQSGPNMPPLWQRWEDAAHGMMPVMPPMLTACHCLPPPRRPTHAGDPRPDHPRGGCHHHHHSAAAAKEWHAQGRRHIPCPGRDKARAAHCELVLGSEHSMSASNARLCL
eukprot:484197-Pelagomonas_calceolata.AAC.6